MSIAEQTHIPGLDATIGDFLQKLAARCGPMTRGWKVANSSTRSWPTS
jgi:hypothetical protein